MVNAIYFKDKDVTHLNIGYLYGMEHFIINGEKIMPQTKYTYNGSDIIVEGRITELKGAHKKTIVSHYMNRENGETMSVMLYNETIASFKNEDGSYKDLDSEYLCRKMEQIYVQVTRTYFEYEDIAFQYDDADLQPDQYVRCEGVVKKKDEYKIDTERFFLYKFDKWKFCCDLIVRLMEEYGIKRVKERTKDSPKECYVLHEESNAYQWVEFCGDQYFLRHEDVFPKYERNPLLVYGSYEQCLEMEKEIEARFRKKIETELDNVRTTNIKISDLQSFYDKLKELAKSADTDRKKTKSAISSDLHSLLYEFSRFAKIKLF